MKAKKRFRLSKNDIVNATLSLNGQLIASVYDTNFTTKDEVFNALCQKTNYKGQKGYCAIFTETTDKYTYFYKMIK